MKVNSILTAIRTLPRLGVANLGRYLEHQAKASSGWYRIRSPRRSWGTIEDSRLQGAASPFEAPPAYPGAWSVLARAEAIRSADRDLGGELRYFGTEWKPWPKDWRSSSLSESPAPLDHWSRVRAFDPSQGDIKWIWEPSRFDWVYTLGRAWILSGDEKYRERFFDRLEDWRNQNPPNSGVNWRDGQECALRLISLAWAAGAFGRGTPELWETVARHAERIEVSTSYALSQNNNHGLAEAAALYVAGCSLPSHPSSDAWRSQGKRSFERQVVLQFKEDGSYAQNSLNYTRLALKLCAVFLHCSRKRGDEPSAEAQGRLKSATLLLYQLIEPRTGRVPNYGANDGAWIMPLSSQPFEDYRPTLQALHLALHGVRLFAEGPWDEEAHWLFPDSLSHPLATPSRPGRFEAAAGGYYVLRGSAAPAESRAFIRCPRYRERPSHADALHLDLWIGGENVAVDSGTLGYFDEMGWSDYFKGTEAHNTVMINGADQMPSIKRFLWGDWTRSRLLKWDDIDFEGRAFARFAGEHSGYLRRFGAIHRRTVIGSETGEWLVHDDVLVEPGREVTATLSWHLQAEAEWASETGGLHSSRLGLWLSVPTGPGDLQRFLHGPDHLPRTCHSPSYGERADACLLQTTRATRSSFRWTSFFGRAPLGPGASHPAQFPLETAEFP